MQAYDRAQDKLLAAGLLLAIDNQIDPTTGTVKLKATFANKNNVTAANPPPIPITGSIPNDFAAPDLKIVAILEKNGESTAAISPYVSLLMDLTFLKLNNFPKYKIVLSSYQY